MAANKICVCILMTLIGANFILADNENPSQPSRADLPSSSMKEQTTDNSGNGVNAPRLTTSLVSCNYTSQSRPSCLNCRQVLQCFGSNLGLRISCRGSRQYCNDGRCSSVRSPACSTNTTSGSPPATPSGSPPATSSGPPPATSSGSPPATSSGLPPATSSGSPPATSSGSPPDTPAGSPPATPSGSSASTPSGSSADTPPGSSGAPPS